MCFPLVIANIFAHLPFALSRSSVFLFSPISTPLCLSLFWLADLYWFCIICTARSQSVFLCSHVRFFFKKQESFLMQNKILFTDQCLAFYSAHGRLVYTFLFREKDQGFTVPEALFPSASTRTSNHSGAGFSLKILSLTSIFWPIYKGSTDVVQSSTDDFTLLSSASHC